MSILIKGMEMPREKKTTLTIFPDGRVYENHGERLWGQGEDCIPWKAVPVPPHGKLIDASTKVTIQIYDDMYEEYREEECTIADTLDRWSNEGCPKAIISAEEERKKHETAYQHTKRV